MISREEGGRNCASPFRLYMHRILRHPSYSVLRRFSYFANRESWYMNQFTNWLSTALGKRVVPRLRESCFLTPSGCGVRVHATSGPLFCPALYTKNHFIFKPQPNWIDHISGFDTSLVLFHRRFSPPLLPSHRYWCKMRVNGLISKGGHLGVGYSEILRLEMSFVIEQFINWNFQLKTWDKRQRLGWGNSFARGSQNVRFGHVFQSSIGIMKET